MNEEALTVAAGNPTAQAGYSGAVKDMAGDKEAFHVPWGKAMMWIFLLSDTFIFSCFLLGYMKVRMTTTVNWPVPSEVFPWKVL